MQKINDNTRHHVVSVVLNRTAKSTTFISMHSEEADEGTHRKAQCQWNGIIKTVK